MKKLGGCLKIIGGFVVVLFVLGLVLGGTGSNKEKASPTDAPQAAQESTEAQAEPEKEAEPEQEPEPEPEPELPAKYAISDEEAVVDDYTYQITGILTNNSGKDRSYVQIEYILYDADGNQFGTALDNINNLKDGGTWKFSATAFITDIDDIASYELADVTGF